MLPIDVFTIALYFYDNEIIRLFTNNVLVKPDLTAIQMMMMYYQQQHNLGLTLSCVVL